ncbi:hypothetical protein BB558_005128 [Smittium angustum]|uniref:Glucosidase II subunit alpha n=1 Tax=Smittium angustum TaxID=133377 RepID=A0A2U1J1C7_SMIAN|nr:hypothetical protein BB558_005128 [Smittium angustum]
MLLRNVLFLGVGFVYFASPVKNEDFKKCKDSKFCLLHRDYASSTKSPNNLQTNYIIAKDSVNLINSELSAHIINSAQNVTLDLKASFLEGGLVRVRVQELNPPFPRFQGPGKYSLKNGEEGLKKIPETKISLKSVSSQDGYKSHTVAYGSNSKGASLTLSLSENPWSIRLLENDTPILELNTLGYFNFEHLQDKKSQPQESNSTSPLDWSENFKSWTDTRPKGPQSFGVDISFPGSTNVYGIPEHASSLSLKTTKGENRMYDEPYRLYNLDVFEFALDTPMALYGSVPVMLSHSKDRTVGVFYMNSAETWVDISKADVSKVANIYNQILGNQNKVATNTHWISESGVMDVFLMPGPTAKDVFSQYASLVGTTQLPREFSIGYHQCRWNYLDQNDVLSVNNMFDVHGIPYDVIWLDIEHTDGKRYFTWDNAKFPDPIEMQNTLDHSGRKLVNVLDPHIKHDDNYYISKQATEKGYFVKRNDGSDYKGWCWPGDSNWIDYTNEEASEWVSQQFSYDRYNGSTPNLFIWNDMNEPSVFNGPEITMEKDNLHFGGVEHRDIHNVYGMLVHKATSEGLRKRDKIPMRPFVLSRAFFSGSQRYGAVWTGDNAADWEHLASSTDMVLTNNLVGMHFIGADIGGFFGNPSPTLLTRWYQLGIWHPFFRAHAHIDTKRREPWLLGEPYLTHIREAIKLRYKLLPYWYTLFYEASKTGIPIVRPMWVEFPENTSTFDITSQFMVGSGLIVAPVTTEGDSVTQVIKFPKEQIFFDFFTGESILGPETKDIPTLLREIPVFAVGGSIIPTRERSRRSSHLMRNDPYTLNIYASSFKEIKGTLYLDDGNSYDYTNGGYIYREFVFKNATLYSKEAERPESEKSAEYIAFKKSKKNIRVERVVVKGMRNSFTKAIISENGVNREVEVTCTQKISGVCTVRDPGVLITEDWSIRLIQ